MLVPGRPSLELRTYAWPDPITMYLSTLTPIADVPSVMVAPLVAHAWSSLWSIFDGHGDGDSEDDLQNWSSLIGIVTAICGNILIALALNVQRYAHIRLHRHKVEVRERARRALRNASKRRSSASGADYGTAGPSSSAVNGTMRQLNGRPSTGDMDRAHETEPLNSSFRSGDSTLTDDSGNSGSKLSATYLKSKWWWMGQILITVGEMGNFLAYGFAPASVVSPLGVFALVANCVIAPIFFKEIFRPRDFWGVIVAIAGAVTVVLSAKQEETKLGPHEVWDAITTLEFKIYMAITFSLIGFLMWLSPRYGNRTILIDLGLVGLFGGYTVLSTKGVSSMLSSTLLGAFATPVTYGLLFVLISTAVMQVRYINKALARFDSTQVIPIQFVSFTLCVIIGSAVLYRDFQRTTQEQAVKFIGGCLLTFFGVFLITSGRPRQDDDDDDDDETLSDAEGIEETINMFDQGPTGANVPNKRRGGAATGSRRSSLASQANYRDTINKPLAALTGTGFPTSRTPSQPTRPQNYGNTEGTSPPAQNIWIDEPSTPPTLRRPGHGPHTISSESVPSIASNAVSDEEGQQDEPHMKPTISNIPQLIEHPVTPPRASFSTSRPQSHHMPMISPSPFSSTVTAVVADKLLGHESPGLRVRSRRSRPGLRNSLFVPQDEISDDEDDLESGIRSAVERRPSEAVLFPDDIIPEPEAEGKKTVKGRARSLSHTLGELLGVGRGKRSTAASSAEESESLLRREGASTE